MKVSYFEGLATHIDPESCGGGRKAAAEALTGESTGTVLSHEMHTNLEANHVLVMGRQHQGKRYASLSWLQRGQRPRARAKFVMRKSRDPRVDQRHPSLRFGL